MGTNICIYMELCKLNARFLKNYPPNKSIFLTKVFLFLEHDNTALPQDCGAEPHAVMACAVTRHNDSSFTL